MRLMKKSIKKTAMVVTILMALMLQTVDVAATANEVSTEGISTEVETTELEEVTTEVVQDTVNEELEEELEIAQERNEYLSNSYKQLEEKYQREKEFSRGVIYTLIFVIAILVVVVINIIVYYRRKVDEDFNDSLEEKKPKKNPAPKKETAPKPEKVSEKPVTKAVEIKREEPEKTASKVEKAAPKVEVRKDFEVFDFNDED